MPNGAFKILVDPEKNQKRRPHELGEVGNRMLQKPGRKEIGWFLY